MKLKSNRGLTLIEILVVAVLFLLLFGAVMMASVGSERSWRTGQDNMACQQQARQVIDEVVRLIRQSGVTWSSSGNSYTTTISDQNKRLDFYVPEFDTDGNISALRKVTFKLDPLDTSVLLKKEGTDSPVVVARDIDNIYFGAGCAGCATFDCSVPVSDCPIIEINVRTSRVGVQNREYTFSLSSRAYLRNQASELASEVTLDFPSEGEF